MNGIYDLKVDIDRLEYFENNDNDEKVFEYKEIIVQHVKELINDAEMHSKELEVKEFISKEILSKMTDQGAAQVLRSILFNENNVIDWNVVITYIQKIYAGNIKRKRRNI